MDTGYEAIREDVLSPLKNVDIIQRWSLAETSIGLGIVLGLYLLLVMKILPDYMKDRQPYSLKSILTKYNAFQVASSAYIVFIYARYIVKHGIITTRCPQGDDLQGVITEIYPYFIAKHLDLLDTVFFVLRKKDNQVTFLHLYHHTAMVSWTWLHLMYHPTDHFVVVGLLNSFVHVLMYAYYGISSMGPEYQKYVWWKKHVTKIQLSSTAFRPRSLLSGLSKVQFVLVISDLHYQQKLTPCPLPAFFHYFCMFSIGSFFVLFLKFYFKSYSNKRLKSNEIKVNATEKDNCECHRFVKSD